MTAVKEKIEKLSNMLGRRPNQVVEDLKIVDRMRKDHIWAINYFFKHGKGWLYDDMADFQSAGVTEFFGPDERVLNLWPRSHCKTTILTRACCALELVLGISPYTTIFSSTEEHARHNRDVFEAIFTKPRFREFQWYAGYFLGAELVRDIRAGEITFGNDAICEFKSFSGEARGSNREGRPYRIHLDDILKTEAATSMPSREEVTDRFFSMIRPMGEQGSKISIVGTVHHRDDLLWKIATGKILGYKSTKLAAYDEVSKKVLWPARYTYEDLMRIRNDEYARAGRIHLFKREYLNDPAESETHPLQAYSIKRIPKVDREGGFRVIAIDNSQGTGQDRFAIVETSEKTSGDIHICAIRASNQWNIDRRIAESVMFVRRRMPDVLVVQRTSESITFIELLAKELKQEGLHKLITQPTWSKSGTKNEYIMAWLQPSLAESKFVAEEAQEFVDDLDQELHAFDYFAQKNLDDIIECLAHCKKFSKVPKKAEPMKQVTGNPLVDRVRSAMMKKQGKGYNRMRPRWVR